MHAMKSNEVNNRTQLDSKLTADAWYVISGDFPFTGQMLRKWQDQLNWENVSSNISIIWTIDMLKEFAEKLNWKSLSSRVNFPSGFFLYTASYIEALEDYWDWDELSSNCSIPFTDELIEKYADRWNWKELLDNYKLEEERILGKSFLEKYKDHITPDAFSSSLLYYKLRKEREDKIIGMLLDCIE
jgi:hypothetical protein